MSPVTALAPRPGVLLPSLLAAMPSGRPALLTAAGDALSYDQLRDAVDALVGELPDAADGRCLVHLPLRPDLAGVTAYLATLEAGHVALVTAEDANATTIARRYRPDLTATGDPARPFEVDPTLPFGADPRGVRPHHLLHPDLALLLSTSGSTGSPKLVRLSHDNLRSNAAAIAAALHLTETDRAITSLPLHYTFGLSVLHSHLAAGGSVVLHDGSVLDETTWRTVDDLGVTHLAVVPHMVELMESTGVLERPHPSLRLIVQAGGRMSPERVVRTAALGRAGGWGLAVMYGQTEATARICVLDPALVAEHPDAVGRPIADTTLHLDTTVPEASGGAGEVVVRGPGVMMGYAEHPDDLALGAMLTELRTGDIGRMDGDGLLRLVGRRSGFVKVMGVRIDVARIEGALESAGFTACVGGDGRGLTVLVAPEATRTDPARPAAETAIAETVATARRLVGEASGLGPAAVTVAVADLARSANGKVDRPGCAAAVRRLAAGPSLGVTDSPLTAEVARAVGQVLGADAVDLDRTFVQLGGDSLSHVQTSIRLEGLVGPLPRGWHHRPLRELVALGRSAGRAATTPPGVRPAPPTRPIGPAPAAAVRASGGPARLAGWWRWHTVEMSIVLRTIAVVLICGSHAELFRLPGGAHTLLAVAGFNAARFGLSLSSSVGRWRASARVLIGVAVPTVLIALVGIVTTDRYGWSNLFLANWLLGRPDAAPTRNELWFVDTLVASTVLFTALLSSPAIARAWRRDPWRLAAVVTAVALVPRFVILGLGDGLLRGIVPTTFWFFALGAAAAYADTRPRRLLTVALAVIGGVTFFPGDPSRNLTIVAGLTLLTLVPSVRVPGWAVPVVSLLAAASLYVYLVQFQVLAVVPTALGGTVASIAVGCLVWRLADRHVRRLQDLVPPPTR